METVASDQPTFQTSAGAISMRITSDIESISVAWQGMQEVTACTGPQTIDWARAWSRHVLAPQGRRPVVAVGATDDGTTQFLLPFETRILGGFRILSWLSQDHANYVFGLFRPDFAARASKSDVSRILHEVGRRSRASVAMFESQPFSWEGTNNPFALLSHQSSANNGYAIRLGDFDALYTSQFKGRARQTLRRKERRLQESGALTYGWATGDQETRDVLAAFFIQKAAQFADMGVTDMFTPEARAFYEAIALLPDDNPSRFRLGYVALDGEILATFSGTVNHDRFGVMLSSMAEGDFQRQSPGALLLRHQINEACNDGLTFYDLGVGAARHKSEWCNEVYPLFDSYIALRPHGNALTLPFAIKGGLKRMIKSTPKLWELAQRVRKTILGGRA